MPLLEHTGERALEVDAGEIVSILGAPGSGKTQLALELAFLARPREGTVLYRGKDPMGRRRLLDPTHRPRGVTMLVQNAEDQLFARTVFDDVSFGPRRLTLEQDEIDRRVTAALQAVGLDPEEIADRSPFALSGGERRRLALAGVLAMQPEVLILDEPTANLDPRTRIEFLDLLAPLRGKSAIVWLTVRAGEAELADRVYLLRQGRTIPVASGGELMARWRELASAGVEVPSIYELASAVEARGLHLPPGSSPQELQDGIVHAWQERHRDR